MAAARGSKVKGRRSRARTALTLDSRCWTLDARRSLAVHADAVHTDTVPALEPDPAVDQSEEGVIPPLLHVEAGPEHRPALAEDDLPRLDGLPSEGLEPPVLRIR